MENERIIYKGYIKGAYLSGENDDIHVLFGDEHETYNLSVDRPQSDIGGSHKVSIEKIDDLIISTKDASDSKIYLPRHLQEVSIDLNIDGREDIDVSIDGIFAVNGNKVISYIDNNSSVLMKSNFNQLKTVCEIDGDDTGGYPGQLGGYLDDTRNENYNIDTIFVDQSLSGYTDIAMAQLEQVILEPVEEYITNKYFKNVRVSKNNLNTEPHSFEIIEGGR